MKTTTILPLLAAMALGLCISTGSAAEAAAPLNGWLHWRGPHQTGVSDETGLPDAIEVGGPSELWHLDIGGEGTPVIAGGRLYALGFRGDGADLQEFLICADAATGKLLWEQPFSDFLSDIIYNRYALGSPAIDPQTGNVYVLTAPNILAAFTPEGKEVWRHSMMEEFGKLTFPNGRNGGPVIDDDLVILHGLTANWGADGPGADRFYAFDKLSGALVWSSTPGPTPKDNSMSPPILAHQGGKRILYCGTGDGSVVCLNVRTGQPLWRFEASRGGVNAAILPYQNMVIAIHADENIDSSEIGRQLAIKVDAAPGAPSPDGPNTPLLPRGAEAWRNNLDVISSSPVIAGDRIYQCIKSGSVCAVDAKTGKVLWKKKLAPEELHASPVYADGKLYVPMRNGTFHILKPTDTGVQQLSKVQLAGDCNGAPSIWAGRLYIMSTQRLYCFGDKAAHPEPPAVAGEPAPKPGKAVALQVIPAEVLMRPGEKQKFTIRSIDASGFPVETLDAAKAHWAHFIPPTAKVRAELKAEGNPQGELEAPATPEPSAGAFEVSIGDLKGYMRGRILPDIPFHQDFEKFAIDVPHATETGVKFAYPPLPWIGARFKWEIREVGGSKVLAKTLDNIFFQRSMVFFGHPQTRNYTAEADLMSDGDARAMSTVGLINQRYMVLLQGNSQELEVLSNQERLKKSVPFKWSPKEWYHLKTRVEVAADGSGVVRAKAWKKGDAEPAGWTIEVPHRHAHQSGSPGLFGFAPSSQFRIYVDNISITQNQ